ncbi:hypothetical protein Ancab_022890 [Ancistrocladus abbreviatus]
MEFLARSWSVSAMELSKALMTTPSKITEVTSNSSLGSEADSATIMPTMETELRPLPCGDSPPISPRGKETKELLLLHQVLHPDFLSNQQLVTNGLYKSIAKGKAIGRWSKEQKERKKHEIRTHNAQLRAAVSVAGVAAAVAALTASNARPSEMSTKQSKAPSRIPAAIASAAALVASHCIEIARKWGRIITRY